MSIKGIFVSNQHLEKTKDITKAMILALYEFFSNSGKSIDTEKIIDKIIDYLGNYISVKELEISLYELHRDELIKLDKKTLERIYKKMGMQINLSNLSELDLSTIDKFMKVSIYLNNKRICSFTLNELIGRARSVKYLKTGNDITELERNQIIEALKFFLKELEKNPENPMAFIYDKIESMFN